MAGALFGDLWQLTEVERGMDAVLKRMEVPEDVEEEVNRLMDLHKRNEASTSRQLVTSS